MKMMGIPKYGMGTLMVDLHCISKKFPWEQSHCIAIHLVLFRYPQLVLFYHQQIMEALHIPLLGQIQTILFPSPILIA